MGWIRRLGGIAALYAVIAAVAIAAPLSASQPVAAPQAPPHAAAPPTAPPPDAPPAPAPPPAAPAPQPAPVAPAPAAEPVPAPAAPAPVGPAPEPQPPRDAAPVAKPGRIAVAAASTGVEISDFEFSPGAVTVNAGDTVTWSNSGPAEHSATATDGSFDTGILDEGGSGSHTFTEAGTFSYVCTPHPFMKGTVTVQAAAADDGDGGGEGQDTGAEGTTPTDSQAGGGPALPDTGMDASGLALLGLMTLALGAYLRRRTGPEPARPAGRIGW
jgi:LPXTG-motif cell wall-anchored protein